MREIVNGTFYVMRAGCAWRLMPSDLWPWETTNRWFTLGLDSAERRVANSATLYSCRTPTPAADAAAPAFYSPRSVCSKTKMRTAKEKLRRAGSKRISRIREVMLHPRCMAIGENDRRSRAQARVASFAFGPTGKLAERSQKR